MADADAGRGIPELAALLVAEAAERGWRVAVAESLTGGLLAASIVGVPGASRVFSGGVVAYDTELKRTLLEVDAELLRERGPVDPEVARQMAAGVRRGCAIAGDGGSRRLADLGISTTGVAGPDPDPQTGQAAGTVWIGVSDREGERAEPVPGLAGLDRDAIRSETVRAALRLSLRRCRSLT